MAKLKAGLVSRRKTLLLIILFAWLASPALAPATPTAAYDDDAKWDRVPIPTEGSAGNWQLADGSDIQHLTMSSDGTLYAYGQGLTFTLYQSTDGGYSWRHLGNVQDSITAIATLPTDANTIYYATSSHVYRSTDGGNTFTTLPPNPGGAGSNNVAITCLDVTYADGGAIIAAGTRDTDNGQFGGIYTLNESPFISNWENSGLSGYDVYAVAFSPNFPADRQLAAVVTNEADTLVTYNIGGTGWGATYGNARLDRDNSGAPTSVAVTSSAMIAFPGNYDASYPQVNSAHYVAIDSGSGNGDVYRINCATIPASSLATDLNAGYACGEDNLDVTSLAVNGDAANPSILAGSASSALTCFSADGGTTWVRSSKEPTGGSKTYVLMAPDFSSSGKAYAATSGSQSALSISQDGAIAWNQIALIDTDISTIVDLSPSPAYNQDNTLFMLTFGGSKHSLWRTLDGGNTWIRVLSSNLPTVDSLSFVELSPDYGNASQVVFLAGSSNGLPSIWNSTDNGQTYTSRFAFNPVTGASINIDTWAAVNDTTLFIGSFDGSNGLIYQTTNSGLSYTGGVTAGNQSLHSIALSPDYQQDKTLLVGNSNGWIFWSGDNGASFKPLPADATSPPLTGSVTVAFDPDFASNRTIYAAGDAADEGIYRFIIGTSTDWESIDSTLPGGGMLNQVRLSPAGILYAANAKADGGMERCLNPTFSLGPTFTTVTRGLTDGATMSGLWQNGHQLWSVDTTNVRLMTFSDCLNSPVLLTAPADQTSGTGTLTNHTVKNVNLDWKTLRGATSYQWQLDHDTDFSAVPDGFEGNTRASSARLPDLEPATTYHWRVRANAPLSSPWSETWSFTTRLGSEVIALKLENPEAGASKVPVRPVFQWSALVGASVYELMVSSDADFTHPSITKLGSYALSATAWQCDVSLDCDTTYYWKVRAINDTTYSDWSAVGAFTTEPPPPETLPELPTIPPAPEPSSPMTTAVPMPAPTIPAQITAPAPPLPTPPQAASLPLPTIPDWAIYLIGTLLLTIILILVIMLLLVLRVRRL